MTSQIRVTNTLSRQTEEFVPVSGNEVKMYVCGPTVQSPPHLGHGRAAVAFDMIRRYLSYRGYGVSFVRNITDVEDKIIAAAAETGETTEELSVRVAKMFAEAYDGLAVLEPDVEPKATEHIAEMLEMIERLIDRGLAYPTENGDVYYSVRTPSQANRRGTLHGDPAGPAGTSSARRWHSAIWGRRSTSTEVAPI